MGGVPSVLLLLWCRGGCSTATVAAALTFFPPSPPCYTLRKKDDSGELELVLDEALESTVSTAEVRVVTIRADRPGTGWVKRKPGVEKSARPPSDEIVPKSGTTSSTAFTFTGDNPGAAEDSGVTRKKKGNVIPLALYRKANARYTVVYSHGNATDIGAMHDRCAGIATEVGVNVLAYDYTGYGAATGSPTEAQTYRDIEAVCAWARRHLLREGEDGSGRNKGHGIILYGQSVGSGPTCYLAAERAKGNFAGVVLHSPILSGMRVLTESRALSCLDIYPNVDRIARVRCPVMVVHGLKDEEVPWEHGKGIFEAVPEKYRRRPWWVPDRGHNDICEGRRHLREFYQRMRTFVQSLDDEPSVPGVIPANQRNAQESDRKPKEKNNSSTSSEQPPSLAAAAVQSNPSSPVTDSTANDSIDCLKGADAGVTVTAESAGDCST